MDSPANPQKPVESPRVAPERRVREEQQKRLDEWRFKQITPKARYMDELVKFADSWNPKDQWPRAISDGDMPIGEQPKEADCTCDKGDKLGCPVHGMHATNPAYEHTYDITDPASPVGYDNKADGPRTWMNANAAIHQDPQAYPLKVQKHDYDATEWWNREFPFSGDEQYENFKGRLPTIYDPGTHTLHMGPGGGTHNDLINAITGSGHTLNDGQAGTPFHGWVGHDAQTAEEHGGTDPEHDPTLNGWGWYSAKDPGEQVNQEVEQALQTPRATGWQFSSHAHEAWSLKKPKAQYDLDDPAQFQEAWERGESGIPQWKPKQWDRYALHEIPNTPTAHLPNSYYDRPGEQYNGFNQSYLGQLGLMYEHGHVHEPALENELARIEERSGPGYGISPEQWQNMLVNRHAYLKRTYEADPRLRADQYEQQVANANEAAQRHGVDPLVMGYTSQEMPMESQLPPTPEEKPPVWSRVAANAIGWTRGNKGKGIVAPDGTIFTWNVDKEGMPHHGEYMDKYHPYELDEGHANFFQIRPRGGLDTEGYNMPANVIDSVLKADPRLKAGEHTDWHFEAKETLPQQLKRWELLKGHILPYTTNVVHEFPNGWTVQEHRTRKDVNRVGQMMANCWQGRAPRLDEEGNLTTLGRPGIDAIQHYMAMHDEHDLPRVAFYVNEFPTKPNGNAGPSVPGEYNGQGESKIRSPYGPRNKRIGDSEAEMLQSYARAHGISDRFEIPDELLPPEELAHTAADSVHGGPSEHEGKVAMPLDPGAWNQGPANWNWYHGTPHENLPSIMEHGILPWDEHGGGSVYEDDPELMPRPGHIYLTEGPTMADQAAVRGGARPIVLQVDPSYLDPANINPDEDAWAFGHGAEGPTSAPGWAEHKENAEEEGRPVSWGDIAEERGLGNNTKDTMKGLRKTKTMAYRGRIPPEALTPHYYDKGSLVPLPKHLWDPNQPEEAFAETDPNWHRASADPSWLNAWIEQHGPYVYHGSDEDFDERIAHEGLVPWNQQGEFYVPGIGQHGLGQPRPDHIYLSTQKPHHEDYSRIYAVDLRKLDPRNLHPDEDYYDEADSAPTHATLGEDPSHTHSSMEWGKFSHKGVIPPEALSVVAPSAPSLAHVLAGWKQRMAEQYYYHFSPPINREQIEQEGLTPRLPRENNWPEYPTQPKGVYAWPDEHAPPHLWDSDDVWRIPAWEVEKSREDPIVPRAVVIQHPVGAELVGRGEDVPERDWSDWPKHVREQEKYKEQPFPSPLTPHEGADKIDTREYPDTRMMPATTMDQPAQQNAHPEEHGCTCDEGRKLDCPVHGLDPDPDAQGYDHSWSIPENHPVGYPQDQPKNYKVNTGASGIKVHEIDPGGDPGTHDMTEEEWHANGGRGSDAQRKPFIYVPDHKTIYLGNPGWYHDDVDDAIFGIVQRQPKPTTIPGIIEPDGSVMVFNVEGNHPQHEKDIYGALGGQAWKPTTPGGWQFTGMAAETDPNWSHSSTWEPEGWKLEGPYDEKGGRCPMCKNHRLIELGDSLLCPECRWAGERFHEPDMGAQGLPRAEGSMRTASWHLTDNPNFTLDPTVHPYENYLMGGDAEKPGMYVTDDPEYWINGHDYVRPYAAELEHPPINMRYHEHPQGYLPAEMYPQTKVKRVIPLDEYAREEYGEPGWIESHHDYEFERDMPKYPNYRYEGPDVRDMTPEEHARHEQRATEYLHSRESWKRRNALEHESSWRFGQEEDEHEDNLEGDGVAMPEEPEAIRKKKKEREDLELVQGK